MKLMNAAQSLESLFDDDEVYLNGFGDLERVLVTDLLTNLVTLVDVWSVHTDRESAGPFDLPGQTLTDCRLHLARAHDAMSGGLSEGGPRRR